MKCAWLLLGALLIGSGCAVHMPNLQEWDVSTQSVSNTGVIRTVYRQDQRLLELYTNDMGELAVFTYQRDLKRPKKEYVFIDSSWQRCQIVDLEPYELYVDGEYVDSGFYVTWQKGDEEFRTRF